MVQCDTGKWVLYKDAEESNSKLDSKYMKDCMNLNREILNKTKQIEKYKKKLVKSLMIGYVVGLIIGVMVGAVWFV